MKKDDNLQNLRKFLILSKIIINIYKKLTLVYFFQKKPVELKLKAAKVKIFLGLFLNRK